MVVLNAHWLPLLQWQSNKNNKNKYQQKIWQWGAKWQLALLNSDLHRFCWKNPPLHDSLISRHEFLISWKELRLGHNPCSLYRNRSSNAIERVVVIGGPRCIITVSWKMMKVNTDNLAWKMKHVSFIEAPKNQRHQGSPIAVLNSRWSSWNDSCHLCSTSVTVAKGGNLKSIISVASVSRDVEFSRSGFAGSIAMRFASTQPKSESNLCPLVIAPAMGGQLMAKGVRETHSWPRCLMLFFLYQLMVFGIGGHGCLFCHTIATAFANTKFYIYVI